MKLNQEGKITYFADRWNDQDPPANFIAWVRAAFAFTVPFLINVISMAC